MPIITYADNQPIAEDGHRGRFILPSSVDPKDSTGRTLVTRTGACVDDIRDNGARTVRKFNSARYDTSDNERRSYAQLAPDYVTAPRRSMVAYEGDVRPMGKLIRASFLFNWQPDLYQGMPAPALLNPDPNAWHVLFQWNSKPGRDAAGKDYRWKSPPFSLAARNIGGVEHIQADTATSIDPCEDTAGEHIMLGRAPLKRGVHQVEIEFVNGAGGDGFARVVFDGQEIARHSGRTGHAGHVNSYAAYGWYQHKW